MPASKLSPAARQRLAWAALGLGIGALAVALWFGSPDDAPVGARLTYLAGRSMLRMLLAFVLSVLFALTYGYSAATNPRARRVLLPLLDILQSVPILAFFPAAVLFFVTLFQGSIVGLEAASVFLIFTSQSWNMAFGVYEAISTIPQDTYDAAEVMGAAGWMRVKRVILPACVPKLVYNGIVSWAGGWYFVTASEIISASGRTLTLPGLGSYIFQAATNGDAVALGLGIGTLVLTVLIVEFLVWRPFQVFAERFKFESTRSATAHPKSHALEYYRILRGRAGGKPLPQIPIPALPDMRHARLRNPRALKAARVVIALLFGVLLLGVSFLIGAALVKVLAAGIPLDARSIPLALLASAARLLLAYVFTLAWTVPLAIVIARNERLSRVLVPLTEVFASIPAVALFPVILLLLVVPTGGLGLASIVLVLTGMQWYLLFNLIAGARQVPADLIAAAEISGMRGWLLWRRVFIPAMMPALITGSITAWGGGWNALIVSEYVIYNNATYHTFGIGYLIDKAVYETPNDPALLLLSVLAMVAFIFAFNTLFWKRMYRHAISKYQLEG